MGHCFICYVLCPLDLADATNHSKVKGHKKLLDSYSIFSECSTEYVQAAARQDSEATRRFHTFVPRLSPNNIHFFHNFAIQILDLYPFILICSYYQ